MGFPSMFCQFYLKYLCCSFFVHPGNFLISYALCLKQICWGPLDNSCKYLRNNCSNCPHVITVLSAFM